MCKFQHETSWIFNKAPESCQFFPDQRRSVNELVPRLSALTQTNEKCNRNAIKSDLILIFESGNETTIPVKQVDGRYKVDLETESDLTLTLTLVTFCFNIPLYLPSTVMQPC